MPRKFGAIAGVPEGTVFASRREVHDAGVHRPLQGGISGAAAEGADSIVVSGGYEDDQDFGDQIVYTGHGGNDPNTGQQIADQVLERGNAALAKNHADGLPVRVVRGANGDPTFSPASGYRYDGLYLVDDYWEETGRSGHRIWRFRLVKQGRDGSAAAGGRARTGRSGQGTGAGSDDAGVGTDYVRAEPTVGTTGEPFEVDPDRLDRATQAHADLQNALADALSEYGIKPLSPALPADPEFDIGWRHQNRLYVCEVKSTTAVNRDRQLRLGLGQVLHYATALRMRGEDVVQVLLTSSGARTELWSTVLERSSVCWLRPRATDGRIDPAELDHALSSSGHR